MKYLRISASLLLVLACSLFSGTQSNLQVGSRTAIVYVPTTINNPAVVISMHGIGIPASMNQGMMQFEKIADTANFIVVYPEAEDLRWDLGSNKDIDYLMAIVDQLYQKHSIDRDRVYATGFSMGGMMSWYLSCKIPDKIAAIVPGNGYPMGGLSGCVETRHVPALQIHGNADNFVSYSGFVGNFMPAQRTRYGCPANPVKVSPYPVGVNGRNASQLAQPSKSFMETWAPCVNNGLQSEMSLLTVNGMIHDWATPNKANANEDATYTGKPFDVNGTWEAWNYMRTRSLKGSTPVIVVPAHRDSVFNGSFANGSTGWSLNVWGGTAQGAVDNGMYKIDVTATGDQSYSVQLVQNGIILEKGKSYSARFDAYASVARSIEVNMEMDVEPWTSYLPSVKSVDLTQTKKSYNVDFTMTMATNSNSRLAFNAGKATGSVFLDNITIREIDAPTATLGLQHNAIVSRIRLISPMGQTVRVIEGHVASLKGLDVSGLPAGLYLVQVESQGKILNHSRMMVGVNH